MPDEHYILCTTLDNTRENLRPATKSQNNANRVYPDNETGYLGVQKDKTTKGSFKSAVSVSGKMVHLGNFKHKDPQRAAHVAALVRDLWVVDLHGEFAKTNFPVISSAGRE